MVHICNNVNLDPEMCLKRERVSIVSQRVWKENGSLSFIDLLFFFFFGGGGGGGGFLRTYISYKQCIENNTKITTNVCN